MEAEMCAIAPLLTGFLALAAVSTHAKSGINNENWRPLGPALPFSLGDQSCGYGWHQALRRDWRGDWWWGLSFQIGEVSDAWSGHARNHTRSQRVAPASGFELGNKT